MARSEEAAAFFHAVYEAILEIPPGRVTTYGHIAMLIGTRACISTAHSRWVLSKSNAYTAQRPRQVGVCLKHLPSDTSLRFNSDNVPWQRVVNAKGTISPRYQTPNALLRCSAADESRSQPAAAQNQAARLQAEGVEVVRGALGEMMIDFDEYGWFPEELPSQAGERDQNNNDDDEEEE